MMNALTPSRMAVLEPGLRYALSLLAGGWRRVRSAIFSFGRSRQAMVAPSGSDFS